MLSVQNMGQITVQSALTEGMPIDPFSPQVTASNRALMSPLTTTYEGRSSNPLIEPHLDERLDNWDIIAIERQNRSQILNFLSCRKLGLRFHCARELSIHQVTNKSRYLLETFTPSLWILLDASPTIIVLLGVAPNWLINLSETDFLYRAIWWYVVLDRAATCRSTLPLASIACLSPGSPGDCPLWYCVGWTVREVWEAVWFQVWNRRRRRAANAGNSTPIRDILRLFTGKKRVTLLERLPS